MVSRVVTTADQVLPVVTVPPGCAAAAPTHSGAIENVVRLGAAECEKLLVEELPEIGAAMASVAAELHAGGMCLLRGVPTTDAVLALMAATLGDVVPATDRPLTFLEDIRPVGEGEPSTRPHSQRRSALMPHTDQSARAVPPGFLVLACVVNDAGGGGESVLVPAEPAVRDLALLEPRLVELLQDPVFPLFNVPKRDFAVTAPLVWFDDDGTGAPRDGAVRTRFREEAVRAGMVEMNRPSDDHVAAFEALASVYHDDQRWLVRRLEPGDVLFFDNTRVLHGRTQVLGEQRRHLKRLNGHFRHSHIDRRRHGIHHAAVR